MTLPAEAAEPKPGILKRVVYGYWNSGYLCIATCAFLMSVQGLAIKLLGSRVPTSETVLVASSFCWLLTWVLATVQKVPLKSPSLSVFSLTIGRGLLGATSTVCFYLSVVLLPLQDAVTLFFCSPVFATLLEWLYTRESQGWGVVFGTGATVAGVVLVSKPAWLFPSNVIHSGMNGQHSPLLGDVFGASLVPAGLRADPSGGNAAQERSHLIGVLLATAAAAANGSGFLVVRMLPKTQPAVVLVWYYHLTVALVAAVMVSGSFPHPAVIPTRSEAMLLGCILCTQFAGQLCINRGFQLVSATKGAAVNVLQVLFSLVWDLTILGDHASVLSLVGSACVAGGVLAVALSKSSAAAKATSAAEHAAAAAGGYDGSLRGDGSVCRDGSVRGDGSARGGAGARPVDILHMPVAPFVDAMAGSLIGRGSVMSAGRISVDGHEGLQQPLLVEEQAGGEAEASGTGHNVV